MSLEESCSLEFWSMSSFASQLLYSVLWLQYHSSSCSERCHITLYGSRGCETSNGNVSLGQHHFNISVSSKVEENLGHFGFNSVCCTDNISLSFTIVPSALVSFYFTVLYKSKWFIIRNIRLCCRYKQRWKHIAWWWNTQHSLMKHLLPTSYHAWDHLIFYIKH